VEEIHGPVSAWGLAEPALSWGSCRLEEEMVQDQGAGNVASKGWLVWGQISKIRLRSVDEMVMSQMQRGWG